MGAALVVTRRVLAARKRSSEWQAVTVNRPLEEVAGVSDVIDTAVGPVEVQVRPDPASGQTELAARAIDPPSDDADTGEAAEVVRQGLEETKAVLEGTDR